MIDPATALLLSAVVLLLCMVWRTTRLLSRDYLSLRDRVTWKSKSYSYHYYAQICGQLAATTIAAVVGIVVFRFFESDEPDLLKLLRSNCGRPRAALVFAGGLTVAAISLGSMLLWAAAAWEEVGKGRLTLSFARLSAFIAVLVLLFGMLALGQGAWDLLQPCGNHKVSSYR